MKYYITYENMEKTVSVLQVVTGVQDAAICLELGKTIQGNEMICTATLLGGIQQIQTVFMADKPADFKEPEVLGFDAAMFLTLASSILALKEKVFIETVSGVAYIGVEGKAKFPIRCMPKEEIPDGIPMEKKSLLIQAQADSKEFISALKAGAWMAKQNDALPAFSNVVVLLDGNNISAYSSNQYGFVKGTAKAALKKEETCDDYLKETGKNRFFAAVPRDAVNTIMKLISGSSKVAVAFSKNHIYVTPGTNMVYTASLGANALEAVFNADQIAAIPATISVVVDAVEVKTSLDLLKKAMKLSPSNNGVIRLCFGTETLNMEQANNGDGSVTVKVIESSLTEKITICVKADFMSESLNGLQNGNLRISLLPYSKCNVVHFCNGSLDAASPNSGMSILLPCKDNPVAEKNEESDAATEGTEQDKAE